MLTDEERKLPDRNPPKHRYDELSSFCKRYYDIECPLTDAEKELIEKTSLDVGGNTYVANHILAVVTAETCNVAEYCENNDVGIGYNYFKTRIRKFFSALDLRKRRLEARGKYIIDSVYGTADEVTHSMQEHADNGWMRISVTDYIKDNGEIYSFARFEKLVPEEYIP